MTAALPERDLLRQRDGARDGKPSGRFAYAYEALQQEILDGRYAPGERLTEAELVLALQVSRSTLRGVLVQLHNEGYLTLEPNRGARVRSFSPAEAVEILEVRETLEAMAASLAATLARPDELGMMDVSVADMAARD